MHTDRDKSAPEKTDRGRHRQQEAWHGIIIVVPFQFQIFDFVNLKREYFVLRHIEGDCETAYFSLMSNFTYHLIIVPFWFCKFGLVNLKTKCGLRDGI